MQCTGQNKRYENILLYRFAVFTVKLDDHYGNHRCNVQEKNVPIWFILPHRWQDGAESLGIESKNCLWLYLPIAFLLFHGTIDAN